MRPRWRKPPVPPVILAAVLLFPACTSLEPIEHTAREEIEFETLAFPGRLWDPFLPSPTSGTPVTVSGLLTVPPTASPLPAVVIAHGCGGVSSAESGWVRELEEEGYASFLIRSFPARGVSRICSAEETINVADIVHDVYRAQEVLDDHPYVDGSRLALMGFSFGGRTALWSASKRFQETYDGEGFAAYLAFYPSTCFIRLEDEAEVSGGPIHIFHGTADDWTPIGQCAAYVDRLRTEGVDAEIHSYEGARHSFDDATLPEVMPVSGLSPGECDFVERDGAIVDAATGRLATADASCVESGVSIGYDPEARSRAIADVMEVLGAVFEH